MSESRDDAATETSGGRWPAPDTGGATSGEEQPPARLTSGGGGLGFLIPAAGGLILAASVLATNFLPFPLVEMDDPVHPTPSEWERFFAIAGGAQLRLTLVNSVGIVFQFAFLVVLARVVAPAGGVRAFVLVAAGALGSLLALASLAVFTAPVVMTVSGSDMQALDDLSQFADAVSLVLAGVEVALAGLAILAGRSLPRWLGWASLPLGVLLAGLSGSQLLAGEVLFPDGRNLAFAGFLIWNVAASVCLLVHGPARSPR
ncbi:hypothetical protein Acsp06_43650 [Actinomycetospora sp. NBRC 106375]|uniref:hypothetical protein n=1 Tax=Actinomycetospora sp. NBRC 106375 TaxID=3032207 RepID=UPI0024A4937F|nr:hypothetical protein [Actinomycetospora sp. NBRC 106375]GLZ48180.1 hypothetical protein Acsp06_43650 [Actinomycetospora sp. NBRC 106375]